MRSIPARLFKAVAIFLVLATVPAFAQAPEPPPLPAAPATPTPDLRALLDQIAACVESGKLNVEIDLQAGRVPSSPGWTVEVIGMPKATLAAEAADGRVRSLDFTVTGGQLLVDGKCLRPDVFLESIHFEEGKGITAARFRGRGIWRPIVAIFRGLGMSALRKLHLRTDIPSVVRGEVLGPKTAAAAGVGASFLVLVREVRIHDSAFAAFGGRPLDLGEMVQFKTASQPRAGRPARIAVTDGVFRPARKDRPAQLAIAGRLDGEVEDGSVAFVGGRSTFSHGELTDGEFDVRSGDDGKLQTTISAAAFALDLTSGQFRLPGGPKIGVDAPSRFTVRKLRTRPDGSYSGTVDADLFGKLGVIDRGGTLVSASNIEMHTRGAAMVDGRATGDVELGFDYRIDYVLVVHYPIAEIGDRRVPLVFEGPFATTLHLEDAGSGDEGVVTGEYRFKVPWPPVEQAAFEVLRAKWSQDIPAVIRDVDFALEPRHFGPCGGTCFLVDLTVTVEKMKKIRGRFFQQVCDTEGKADLVVDAPARRFLLRNVRIAPRCEGVFGWIVNVITPFLTTTYTDVTLFQMPANLPFTIESVDSGTDWLGIAGKIAWASKASETPSKPVP
ncbi:MAG TPA: hypothetical protein VFS34_03115 [Thermoanaerobaculia bacterium]|nr:hypothetical protein [Thermoanaerobaculia bacterium]